MAFATDEVRANRDYFNHKLHAEKARSDVLHAVQGEHPFHFTLLDTRGRQSFGNHHMANASNTLKHNNTYSRPDQT